MRWLERHWIEDAMNAKEACDGKPPRKRRNTNPAPAPQNTVPTDADSVRRELMALSRRDVITDRDRVLIGVAIGLIGAADSPF